MGIYDREYYGSSSPSGMSFGTQRAMVTNLVIINVALFILDAFVGNRHWLMNTMAATPESLTKPWLWWQLLTYGFAHSYENKWHILGNMFGLWMFGRAVEGVYGRWEILRIYLVTIVLGGMVWAARAALTVDPQFWPVYRVVGASGAVTAIILLFCVHFPRQTVLLMFVFPIPAWVLGVMIVVLNILGMGDETHAVAYDVHLVGVVFALLYWRFRWNLGRWTTMLPRPGQWLRRRRLKVHRPPREDDSIAEEGDRLLAKVNEYGIDSLTARERKVLEEYSRRMKQKHR